MIQAMLIKLIFKAVMNKINEKHNLNKIDKYVNEDNELDIQVRQLQKTVNKYGKYIEEIEKDVGKLNSDSHQPLFTKRDKKAIEKLLKRLEKK